jgi:threonine-phosphate decarboxylase
VIAPTHGGDIFAVSRARNWDWRDVIDFSASINPLGPAPAVRQAIQEALDRIVHYPEREPVRLLKALAAEWNLTPEHILPGNGATDLLHFFARSWRRTNVSLAAPSFSEFHRAYPNARHVPADDIDAWPGEGLLIVTQPNNPLGFCYGHTRLRTRILDSAQPILVDESFLEFTGERSMAEYVDRRRDLFVLRSLTKFHALPGLRIGALVGGVEALARLRPLREPWQVNVLAEEAALAALAARDHARSTLDFIGSEREWLSEQVCTLPGADPQPSRANYLFVGLAYPSNDLCAFLLERKILVRDCANWPGFCQNGVRIAVRRRAENERLLAAWREFPCAG